MTSPIYRSALVYEATMLALYRGHYFARQRAVADLIPPRSSVLDLGCGTGVFYSRWLRGKAVEYMGLDINATFVDRLTRLGVNARVWDLRRPDPLPAADAVVMQSSLYHFLPDVAPILARMIASARRQVIVSEPIRNLAGSPVPILGTIARRLKRSAAGAATGHFTEETLDAVFAPYSTSHARSFLIPGGRDKVYVLATG